MALQVGGTTTAHPKTSWQEDQQSAHQHRVGILGSARAAGTVRALSSTSEHTWPGTGEYLDLSRKAAGHRCHRAASAEQFDVI